MLAISGVAKKHDGTAIDYVSIFNWVDGTCIAQVKTNSLGAWEYKYLTDLNIGITYVADGCQSISHGPYYIQGVKPQKWWRIIGVKNAKAGEGSNKSRSIAELRFHTFSGLTGATASKAFAASALSGYSIVSAFDNNPSTFFHSGYNYTAEWFIGYKFDNPEILNNVSLQMRGDMEPNYFQEWQTADIESSEDGITWTKCGTIAPRITNMDLSLISTPVVFD